MHQKWPFIFVILSVSHISFADPKKLSKTPHKAIPKSAPIEGFDLANLDPGTDVTLPIPATTVMSITNNIQLSSTDDPQTMTLTAIAPKGTDVVPVVVALYDEWQDKVQYVTLSPGHSFQYPFKKLSTVNLVPKSPENGAYRIIIESDKPLTISR